MEDEMAGDRGTPQRGAGPLGGESPPALGARWRREFAGSAREVAEVRQWLASVLPDCQARRDLASVASELASNAIRHTASGQGGKFAVEVRWLRGLVRVAVADGGAPGGPRVVEDPAGESGRGMLVVRGLSARSGVRGDARGRVVWAEIAWDGTEPARPRDHGDDPGGDPAGLAGAPPGLAGLAAGQSAWPGSGGQPGGRESGEPRC